MPIAVTANGDRPPPGHKAAAFTEARLSKPPHPLLNKYDVEEHLERELRQFDQYLEIDLAHLVMLTEQDIVAKPIARQIFPTLVAIREAGPDALKIDVGKGTLLLQIEAALVETLGEDVAGYLHTARSRIDQGATARRMFKRGKLLQVMTELATFERTMLEAANRFRDTPFIYHTHMQQAQVGNFGHYLLSMVDRLHDDFERCVETMSRVNRNPLGGVGTAGTSWPIDRSRTTELLGFDQLLENSKLIREAYYAAEIASALGFIMATLNDLTTDLHVWASNEFGIIEIDDSFCSTSSIFPQKKNPTALEVVRLAAGQAITWGSAALATFRGHGTGDQAIRTVPLLDDAFETTRDMLLLTGGVMESMRVNDRRVEALLSASWVTSSNLADQLVRFHGLSFRQAHHVIARLVRLCETGKVTRSQVTPALVATAAMETIGSSVSISRAELVEALDHSSFILTRDSQGSVGPQSINALLVASTTRTQEDLAWVVAQNGRLKRSSKMLQEAVRDLMV